MPITLDGTAGITNDATDLNYTGTLTGGTGVINIGSGQLYKDASGNVGIGVVPSAWRTSDRKNLQIVGGAVSAGETFSVYYANAYLDSSAVSRYVYTGTAASYSQSSSGHIWSSAISGTAGDPITFLERMRIDTSGNLLVGTTSDWFGRKFVSESATQAGVFITNSVGGSSLDCLNTATSGDNLFVAFYTEARSAVVNRGTIDFNRAAGLTRYNTTSDATLKNLIGDADGAKSVEILSTTRIREYAWKSDLDQKPQIGVIAQELYETFKGAVSVGGEKEDGTYRPWGVDKTAFTFHLIAGWQAHQKIIEEQQAMITSQSEIISAQQAALEQLKADVAELKGAQA
jgi:hypothetical protein